MTHRSRIGGPPKSNAHRKGSSAAPVHQRKLHHPPTARAAESTDSLSEEAEASLVCPEALLKSPSDKQVLDLLYAALRSTIASPDFVPTIQRIKALLYDEKWLEVFEDAELLPAYAGRWVPSRALCFRELMGCLGQVRGLFEDQEQAQAAGVEGVEGAEEVKGGQGGTIEAEIAEELHVLSLGGGAGSELLALAALLRGVRGLGHRYTDDEPGPSERYRPVRWTGVDIGAWASVLDTIGEAVHHTWKGDIERHYTKTNLLDASSPATLQLFADLADRPPHLTTLFFTLTELLSQSPQQTIAFLSRLTAHTPRGGYLLVADSASDISSFSLGAGGREWPTYIMIDLVLLRLFANQAQDGEQAGAQWEKVESSDSRWFRLAPGTGASWPVKLENARYWFRLYRRI